MKIEFNREQAAFTVYDTDGTVLHRSIHFADFYPARDAVPMALAELKRWVTYYRKGVVFGEINQAQAVRRMYHEELTTRFGKREWYACRSMQMKLTGMMEIRDAILH